MKMGEKWSTNEKWRLIFWGKVQNGIRSTPMYRCFQRANFDTPHGHHEFRMQFWPTRTDSHAVSHFKELWGLGPTPGKYSHIIPFFLGGGLFAELSFFHRARLHEEQAAMCWTLDLKQCKYVVDPKTKGGHNFLPPQRSTRLHLPVEFHQTK